MVQCLTGRFLKNVSAQFWNYVKKGVLWSTSQIFEFYDGHIRERDYDMWTTKMMKLKACSFYFSNLTQVILKKTNVYNRVNLPWSFMLLSS